MSKGSRWVYIVLLGYLVLGHLVTVNLKLRRKTLERPLDVPQRRLPQISHVHVIRTGNGRVILCGLTKKKTFVFIQVVYRIKRELREYITRGGGVMTETGGPNKKDTHTPGGGSSSTWQTCMYLRVICRMTNTSNT